MIPAILVHGSLSDQPLGAVVKRYYHDPLKSVQHANLLPLPVWPVTVPVLDTIVKSAAHKPVLSPILKPAAHKPVHNPARPITNKSQYQIISRRKSLLVPVSLPPEAPYYVLIASSPTLPIDRGRCVRNVLQARFLRGHSLKT
jgi:hypothetical protein